VGGGWGVDKNIKRCNVYLYEIIFLVLSSFFQYFPGSPVLAVLSWQSHHGYPFLTILSWLSYPGSTSWKSHPFCPFLAVLSWLHFPSRPVVTIPSCWSCSGCTLLEALFFLSCSGYPVLTAWFLLSCPGLAVLLYSSCHALIVLF
jgi:hypothetical protein